MLKSCLQISQVIHDLCMLISIIIKCKYANRYFINRELCNGLCKQNIMNQGTRIKSINKNGWHHVL